jgi:glycosyltransferase involved in cell wall biosynthesis
VTPTRLRIGVDGRAFASPAGGVRRYVSELYGALASVAPDVEVVAIGASAQATLPPNVAPRPAASLPTNLGWMGASLPLAVRAAHVDVFHAPAYTAPLWGVHPQVVTIHDVSYERKPEWNAYRNDRFRRAFYRRAALAADRIVTDSAFSREEITAAYGIAEETIAVVPLAASSVFSPGPFDASRVPAGVTAPYALHVGDLHMRRNLRTAIEALLALRQTTGARLRLVCAGIDRGIGAELRAAAAADPDALVLTGPVTEDALVQLYRGAALLVYPSMYEGFGLPVLEAMQSGLPVVAARCASVPEVAGDAGILLDPLDVRAWRDAVATVTSDEALGSRLRDAGLARAAQFTWSRTAAGTLAVLGQAVAEARR